MLGFLINEQEAEVERLLQIRVRRVVEQAFDDDYPSELDSANVVGRKSWRKNHLLDLLAVEFRIGHAEEIK